MVARPTELQYSPDEDESLSVAIVAALAEARGRDITAADCSLYERIDPETIDELFGDDRAGDTITVEFTIDDALVVIRGNDEVTVRIVDRETAPEDG